MSLPGPDRIRSAARGAVAASGLGFAGHLGGLAGWAGFAHGRSTLFAALAAATLLASALGPTWNRLFPGWKGSVSLSVLGVGGFALLTRIPEQLQPTGNAVVDACLVLLLPSLPLAAHLSRRPTSFGFAALGAAIAVGFDERLLLPRAGFSATLLLWAAAWALVEIGTWEDEGAVPSRPNRAQDAGLVLWTAAAGFLAAVLLPFLAQYFPTGRAAGEAIAVPVLALGAAGWFVAAATSRPPHRPWFAWTSVLCFAVAAWAAWEALSIASWSRWPVWLHPLRNGGSPAVKSALAVWVFLALPALCAGWAARALLSGRAASWVLLWIGVATGTCVGERLALPPLDLGGAWESAARARLSRPPRQSIRDYALNPRGASTRYPSWPSAGSGEATAWQSRSWTRGGAWGRLEACEILAAGFGSLPEAESSTPGFLCVGFVQVAHASAMRDAPRSDLLVLDPLPRPGERPGGERTLSGFLASSSLPLQRAVILSSPASPRGLSLAQTSTTLDRLSRRLAPDGTLWLWCDPRGLDLAGLRTTLATWRAAFPDGTVHALFDGYAGPLVGLRAMGPEPRSPDLDLLELFRVPARELDLEPAFIATADRPLLEWESQSEPAASDMATGAVLRLLGSLSGLAPGHPAVAVLEALARHSESQEERGMVASAYDRIRVPEAEIEAWLEALRAAPRFDPLLRQLDFVAGILDHKRDFDLVLRLMRAAAGARPDVAVFHRHLGVALIELLDSEAGLAELEQAYSLAPERIEIRTELAKAYADAGRLRDAAPLLESVWAEKPEVEVAKGLGLLYFGLEDFPRARRLLEFVQARSPGDVEVSRALGSMARDGR